MSEFKALTVHMRIWRADSDDANDVAALLLFASEWIRETPHIAIQDITVWISDERTAVTIYYVETTW
jgi:hypothetical protein